MMHRLFRVHDNHDDAGDDYDSDDDGDLTHDRGRSSPHLKLLTEDAVAINVVKQKGYQDSS